jgi:hypothetical protein
MYSTDFERISLDEFQEILWSVDLLPSRKILLDGLSTLIEKLKKRDIDHLGELQKLLKNKKRYPGLAGELTVSVEYLTVLNREINSYVTRPVPLTKLDAFTDAELERLEVAGLKSTRDLYERGLTPFDREALSEQLSIPQDKIVAALELSDLLRINGVGPVYAKILKEMGIKNAALFLEIDPQETVEAYRRINAEKHYSKVNLGIKDVEYVKRFCQKLDFDIQW